MVRYNNLILFWIVNNNCNVLFVKCCVVFYFDFVCLSIYVRYDIFIWNIVFIEMMDEKYYIKIWLVSWLFLELEFENCLYYLYSCCIWKIICNFFILFRIFCYFKMEFLYFYYEIKCVFYVDCCLNIRKNV